MKPRTRHLILQHSRAFVTRRRSLKQKWNTEINEPRDKNQNNNKETAKTNSFQNDAASLNILNKRCRFLFNLSCHHQSAVTNIIKQVGI